MEGGKPEDPVLAVFPDSWGPNMPARWPSLRAGPGLIALGTRALNLALGLQVGIWPTKASREDEDRVRGGRARIRSIKGDA